jgi:hypothetical protein
VIVVQLHNYDDFMSSSNPVAAWPLTTLLVSSFSGLRAETPRNLAGKGVAGLDIALIDLAGESSGGGDDDISYEIFREENPVGRSVGMGSI